MFFLNIDLLSHKVSNIKLFSGKSTHFVKSFLLSHEKKGKNVNVLIFKQTEKCSAKFDFLLT